MILRAVIIDDEQKGIDSLNILIQKFADDVKVVAHTTHAAKAIDLIESYRPEIVFLDIQMPEMNGFEMLEKLVQRNFSLVFTTAYEEYALKALKNNAVDYLLKPIGRDDLKSAIARIRSRLSEPTGEKANYEKLLSQLNQNNRNKLLINSKKGMEYLDLEDICWIESKSNYTFIYLSASKKILTSRTLKELEELLCQEDQHFIRVHNSFIINLNKVLRFVKTGDMIIMADGQQIPLSKSRKPEFFKWLNV
jgi:two-component system LytT family response regulator